MLIVMAGLPGAGKSSVASAIAHRLSIPVVAVDPIEVAMWSAGVSRQEPTGVAAYVVAETVAEHILANGVSVIVDAVNDVEVARQQWRDLSARRGVALRWVEVVCSDLTMHRRRLKARRRGLTADFEPTWDQVEARRPGFDRWTDERIAVDTVAPIDDVVDMVIDDLLRPKVSLAM